jgi:hypothetical protein
MWGIKHEESKTSNCKTADADLYNFTAFIVFIYLCGLKSDGPHTNMPSV